MAIETSGRAPAPQPRAAYAFGPFVLDLGSKILYRTGLPVETPAKVFEILCCLVVRGDRLVSKEVLVEEVWDGSPIGDNNIAQHMHLVRHVLGDLTKPYRYIITVHGRGYRFIGQPRRVSPPDRPSNLPRDVLPQALAAELLSNAAFFVRLGTPPALESGVHLCRKALDVYPDYAGAYAEIANIAILKAVYGFAGAAHQLDIARRNAGEALRLDAYCVRAHCAMAAVTLFDDRNPALAEEHLDAATAMQPDGEEIAMLRIAARTATGNFARSREAAQSALALHPASGAIAVYGAFADYHGQRLEASQETLERLLIFKPGAAFATYLLGLTFLAQSRYAAARECFQTIIGGRISIAPSYEKFRQRALGALSYVEARSGSAEEAKALARDLLRSEPCSYVTLALAYAGQGEAAAVVAALREARDRRDPLLAFVGCDPLFYEFYDLPDFAAIVASRISQQS